MDTAIGSVQAIAQIIVCGHVKIDTYADGNAIRHKKYW